MILNCIVKIVPQLVSIQGFPKATILFQRSQGHFMAYHNILNHSWICQGNKARHYKAFQNIPSRL